MGNMKDSGIEWIGMIPEEWDISKVKYSVKICNGKEVETDEGNIPVYGTGGAFKTTNKALYKGISVLLGRKGTIDKPLLVDDEFWTVDTAFYTIMNPNILPKLFYYFATCFDYKYYQTGSTVPSMTQTDLGSIVIPAIKLEEQQLIANFLDDKVGKIDDILADLRKQVETLQKYKKSVITKAVTKGLNPNAQMKDSGIDWIGEISEHWIVSRLKYVTETVTVGLAIQTTEYYRDEGVAMLRNTNIEEGYLDESEILYLDEVWAKTQKEKQIKTDDIISIRTGYIGKSCLVPEKYNNCLTFTTLVSRPNQNIILPKYLMYFINASRNNSDIYFSSDTGVMNNLNTKGFVNLETVVPKLTEQKEIIEYLDDKCFKIDELIKDKEAQIEKMEKYKKSLIYEYVTGKKRVKGAV